MPLDESTVSKALVRICDAQKRTLGTGFFASGDGVVITCHHVAVATEQITIQDSDGVRYNASLTSIPEFDIAILKTGARPSVVLPIETEAQIGDKVWMKGFQYQKSVLDGFPLDGTISGITSIRFKGTVEYEIHGVLVLAGASIDHGMSGAPLFLFDDGVVVGVVNTKMAAGGGFAIPFSTVVRQAEGVRTLCSQNRNEVPRWGRFINAKGAYEWSNAYSQATVSRLVQGGQFLPERYCNRENAEEQIRNFLGTDDSVLAIVGASGVGKTTLLAKVAEERNPAMAVLLLSGYRLDFSQPSLRQSISEELQQFEWLKSKSVPDINGFVNALREGGKRLLVIVEGLNEAVAANIRDWLERTCEWAEKNSIKLIFSSRPEYWEIVSEYIPERLLFKVNEQPSLRLDEFSDDEFDTAIHRYDVLEAAAIRIQHPLFIRMYWETSKSSSGEKQKRPGYYAVLDRFIHLKCRNVGRKVSQNPLIVRQRLLKIAARMYERDDLVLHASISDDGANGRVDTVLIEENVLQDVRTGLRFTFDEMAEFLVAEAINIIPDNDVLAAAFDQKRERYVAFALAQMEDKAPARLKAALENLTAQLYESVPHYWIEFILGRTFTCLEDPNQYADVLIQWAQKRSKIPGQDLFNFLESIVPRITTDNAIRVLHFVIPEEHYYDWETKRWIDKRSEDFFSSWQNGIGPGPALLKIVRKEPLETRSQLISWLNDNRPLRENGPSKVHDVAAAALFHTRDRDFDNLCDLLKIETNFHADWLLWRMAETDPEKMGQVLRRWNKFPENDLRVAQLGSVVLSRGARGSIESTLNHILETSANDQASSVALLALTKLADRAPALLPKLEARFLSESASYSASELSAFLPVHIDFVLNVLDRRIEKGDAEAQKDALMYLRYVADHRGGAEPVVTILRKYHATHKNDLPYAFGNTIESLLYVLKLGTNEYQELLSLARSVLVNSEAGQRSIFYWISSRDKKQEPKSSDQLALLRVAIENVFPGNVHQLIETIADKFRTFNDTISWLAELYKQSFGTEFSRGVLRVASKEKWLPQLYEWLTLHPSSWGPYLDRFREEVPERSSFDDAVRYAAQRVRNEV